MAEHITACPKCGSLTYFVHEWYIRDGEVYDGALLAHLRSRFPKQGSDVNTQGLA